MSANGSVSTGNYQRQERPHNYEFNHYKSALSFISILVIFQLEI